LMRLLLPKLLCFVLFMVLYVPAYAQSYASPSQSSEIDRNPRTRYAPHLQANSASNPLTRAMNQIQPASGQAQPAAQDPTAAPRATGYYDANGQYQQYPVDSGQQPVAVAPTQLPDPSGRNNSPLYMATVKAAATAPVGSVEGRNVNVTYAAPSKSSMAYSNQYRDDVRPVARVIPSVTQTAAVVAAQPTSNNTNTSTGTPLSHAISTVQTQAAENTQRLVSNPPREISVIPAITEAVRPNTTVVHQANVPTTIDVPASVPDTVAPAVSTSTRTRALLLQVL
jgi:hypothetical protein